MGDDDNLGQITQLLVEMRNGNPQAEATLIPLVYQELRELATYYLRMERPNHTLQATALVNEAYLKLAGNREMEYVDRSHFFAVAASAMRRILVDYARNRGAAKRGGGAVVIALDGGAEVGSDQNLDQILYVDNALNQLAGHDQRIARVVELRYFSGLEIEEIARLLTLSSRTIKRDLKFAKAWLYDKIASPELKASAAVSLNRG